MIDTSRRSELTEIADIELAKDEDSVTTLAVASSTDTALTAIAGINGSVAEQEAGKNEHLRTFRIALPRKRKADGSVVETTDKSSKHVGTQALGKTALFRSAQGPKNDTYQRVLRASPVQSAGEARITAIASGLAPENEIIAFQPVSNALTSAVDEISRITLGKSEAADVDVVGVKENGHVLAYCMHDAIYLQKLPTAKGSRIKPPVRMYQCPESTDSTPLSQRPKFRALRFLTPKHILFLQNRPGRAGAGLGVLKISEDESYVNVTLWKKLKKSTRSAVGLDVCALTESQSGEKQFIIAVAGQDSSIEILTINHISFAGLGTFKPYTYLPNVHAGPLTHLTFSNFMGPPLPISRDTPPQSVRLASVGVDQTVVVHHFPLRPHPITNSWPQSNINADKPSYVLVPPGSSEIAQVGFSVLAAILVATVAAFLVQAFCEIRGAVSPTLGAPDWLSTSMRDKIYLPYVDPNQAATPSESIQMPEGVASAISAMNSPSASFEMPEAVASAINAINEAPSRIPLPGSGTVQNVLSDVVSQNSQLETPKAIVVRDTGSDLSAELHHDADVVEEGKLKKWEDLSEHQKRAWKERLTEAGHWAEQQGESVLKGVLFSALAAAMR